MGFRNRLRSAAVQAAGALHLDELMLARVRAGGFLHAVNFHGTPLAMRDLLVRQLEWLRSRFTVLDPMAPGSLCEDEADPHKPLALLTFDDGLASNFLVAAPVLESLGLRGLFFCNPGFAELEGAGARVFYLDRLAARRDQPLSPEDWTPMTPAQIAELARRGHAIGNHTYSHADLSRTGSGRLAHEIVESRDVLAKWTGSAIESFAWTYRATAISREAWNLARSHHRFCFAPCAGLTSRSSGSPDLIWRTNVECGYSEAEYRFMYSGLAAIPAWPKRRRLKRELCQAETPSSGGRRGARVAAAVSVTFPGQNAWRRVSAFAGYGGSVLLLQALRFGVSLLCARIAGPSEWGFWTLLNSVLAYSYIADFGVVNGMNRDIALFRGRGDRARVAAIANTSKSLVLCTSALCALAAAAFALTARDSHVRINLLVFALLLFFYKLFNFAQIHSMAHDDFVRVTKANFCLAVVTVPCLMLVFAGGLRGFLWAQVLSFAVGGCLYIAPLARNFRWSLDRAELVRLAKGGLPIAAVGITAIFIGSIDRWMVAAFLGVNAVGQYALLVMVWSTVSLVPQIVATRMYPRIAEAWGRTGDLQVVAGLLKESTRVGLALTASVVLAVETVVPQLVERFLPAYAGGIPAMRIAAPGFLFQAAVYCYANIFNVIGKQQHMLAVQAVAACATVAATAGFLALGWGLEGAALGATLGSCIYCGGLMAATRRLLTKV